MIWHREAARFVSLLRHREDDLAGGLPGGLSGSLGESSSSSSECWCLLHTLLTCGSASKASVDTRQTGG